MKDYYFMIQIGLFSLISIFLILFIVIGDVRYMLFFIACGLGMLFTAYYYIHEEYKRYKKTQEEYYD